MKSVGITGKSGFLGYHLYQAISLLIEEFALVEFDRSVFDDIDRLDAFVSKCDVIIHLAAVNRHNDANSIYEINLELVNKLISSVERTKSQPHIIMSSSIQEECDNLYGKSKKVGRLALASWAKKSGGRFTGLIIPNVYGPFGKPYFNSVVATFCYQIARDETPNIHVDSELKLIYVAEVVSAILQVIRFEDDSHAKVLKNTAIFKVSEILEILKYFKFVYQDNGEFPALINDFELNLFNTYRSYIEIPKYFPRKLQRHFDDRGLFVEIARHGISGQTSFSTTLQGITRGNHYHTRKIERFAVIQGKALIQLRRVGTSTVYNFHLDGNEPAYVDIPIWYTHNIKNIGDTLLSTIFWINEPYDINDPDTYLEIV